MLIQIFRVLTPITDNGAKRMNSTWSLDISTPSVWKPCSLESLGNRCKLFLSVDAVTFTVEIEREHPCPSLSPDVYIFQQHPWTHWVSFSWSVRYFGRFKLMISNYESLGKMKVATGNSSTSVQHFKNLDEILHLSLVNLERIKSKCLGWNHSKKLHKPCSEATWLQINNYIGHWKSYIINGQNIWLTGSVYTY